MILGVSFMLFLLVAGVVTLGMAISIAVRPDERKVLAFRPMSACTVSAIAAATAAGLATTLTSAAGKPGGLVGPEATAGLLAGLAESMVPPLVGFALLAVAWLLVALGLRRQG
ncbi:MAG: hypothetical protein HY900_05390 [Deltaproteobacteria bacterium]|nr:hypothetical protein [Deltaproteobacteria bacterium]